MTLVFPDKSGCMNLLLIDSSIPDALLFASSTNDATLPITYTYDCYKTELLELLQSKFTSIQRIGIAFSFSGPSKSFLDNQTFFETDFFISVIQTFHVTNIDFLTCNTLQDSQWSNYYALLTEQTGVVVGASNDQTGNIKYGGDWTMESTSEDIELIYFTESIEYYSYLLDSSNSGSVIFVNTSGRLFVVGYNANGQLGNGGTTSGTATGTSGSSALTQIVTYITSPYNAEPYLLGTGITTTPLVCTSAVNSYVYTGTATSKHLYSCGLNTYGQLGNGTILSESYFKKMTTSPVAGTYTMPSGTPTQMVSGNQFVFILMDNGSLWGAGNNNNGQLCKNTTTTHLTILTEIDYSDDTFYSEPLSISCGDFFIAVLMVGGSIYVSGNNDFGQLGTSSGISTANVVTPIGGITGSTRSKYNRLTELPNTTGLVPIYLACGSFHTVVIMDDGSIWGCGLNNWGQLGLGGLTIGTYSSGNYITTLTKITSPYTGKPIAVACGAFHTIVLTYDLTTGYKLYATGRNDYGQLGYVTTFQYSSLLQLMTTPVPFTSTVYPIQISCSFANTWVVLSDTNKTLYVTGDNTYGQCHDSVVNATDKEPKYSVLTKSATSTRRVNSIDTRIYTDQFVQYNSSYSVVYCFHENTQILTSKGYTNIQHLSKGDLIKTYRHGYVPLHTLITQTIHTGNKPTNQLYICDKNDFHELTEDLVLTGGHSILVDEMTNEEIERTIEIMGKIFTIDDKYRLPACANKKTKPYPHGTYKIYHIALDHEDETQAYGIYANGLLVESCSINTVSV